MSMPSAGLCSGNYEVILLTVFLYTCTFGASSQLQRK